LEANTLRARGEEWPQRRGRRKEAQVGRPERARAAAREQERDREKGLLVEKKGKRRGIHFGQASRPANTVSLSLSHVHLLS